MRAFVKTNNGTFPNLNFFLAWEAFNTMGYSVTCFEEKDIDTLPVTPDTPVFAGVTIFRRIIDKMGVKYPPFDCYPDVLNPYYGRNIRRSTLGAEKAKFHSQEGNKVFVKPVLPKQFNGRVWNTLLDLIPLAKIPDEAEVWVCEPVDIISEFRVYVHDGDILGVKHYWGEWNVIPAKYVIEKAIKSYKPCPIAYGIDFAAIEKPYSDYDIKSGMAKTLTHLDTIVMEVNDGCNLGNYGLDSIHYGEMIVARWFEIMGQGGKTLELNQALGKAYAEEMHNRMGGMFTQV